MIPFLEEQILQYFTNARNAIVNQYHHKRISDDNLVDKLDELRELEEGVISSLERVENV
jgi:hypothetical protein